MSNERYIVEQLSDHLFVVGQAPTPSLPPTSDGNLYLVVGEESVLAVDAGSGTSFPFVLAAAARFGFADRPLAFVLLTHEHWDHAWGLNHFRQRGAVAVCSSLVAAGLPGYFDPTRDITIRSEGVIRLGEFAPEAVFTPGHTPSSTSFRLTVDGQVCLFTGDTITEDGGLGYAGSEGFSKEQLLESLRKLAAMSPPADRYLPGHLISPTFDQDPNLVLAQGIARGEAGAWEDDWSERKERLARALFDGYSEARSRMEP